MSYRTILLACAGLTTALALSACNPDDTDGTDGTDGTDDTDVTYDSVPFAGDWVDGFDGTHTITDDDWTMGASLFTFVEVDATNRVVIAENDANNEYNPGLYSRFDWVVVDGATWFCQTAYDAADAQAASDTPAADSADPATTGCGGFSWSRLYTPLDIRGDWGDNFGGSHTIREWTWTMGGIGRFNVASYSNDDGVLIAQNDAENEYSPNLWSRFDWTVQGGTTYFCQTAYDKATQAEAESTAAADDTNPTTSGCGGFSWTELTPPG